MKVIVSAQVRDFLFSSNSSGVAAKRLTQWMREASTRLSQYPMIGPERILPKKGPAALAVDDYVLDYEIPHAEIHFLAMRQGRQRDPQLDEDPDFDVEVPQPAPPGRIATPAQPLASSLPLLYHAHMTTAANRARQNADAFAPSVLRALSSAILLLGLIGDRRAR